MKSFSVAAAQIAVVRGDVPGNVAVHAHALRVAGTAGVAVVVFPELSLTGYEPDLANTLAMYATDERLQPLRHLAQEYSLYAVIGAPIRRDGAKPVLGSFVLTPDGSIRTYAKIHLGGNEGLYFTPGHEPHCLTVHGHTMGLAICADASQPSHPEHYVQAGASIYAASVFLTAEWYATDAPRLHGYARTHQLLVLLANQADSLGTYRSVGKSAIIAPDGAVLAEAIGTERCLVLATATPTSWYGTRVGL